MRLTAGRWLLWLENRMLASADRRVRWALAVGNVGRRMLGLPPV